MRCLRKYIRVAKGRFHGDPPKKGCGVLSQTSKTHPWIWANEQRNFDPIAFGRQALKDPGMFVQPCLRCFPDCKR